MSSRSSAPQPRNDRIVTFGNREYSVFGLEHRIYCLPVDEDEEEREDEFNQILRERLGGTVLVPFPPDDEDEPAVLDCGFGKGSWIDDLLSEHPDCEVTGVDLHLGEDTDEDEDEDDDEDDNGVQEFFKKRWNLNASFADDRSQSRLRPESFDLINCRCVAEGLDRNRWPTFIGELKRLLTPGGRIQMVEPYLCFQSDNGRLLNDAVALNAWWRWYKQYMEQTGRDPQVGMNLERHLRAQGFERVTSTTYRLPIGPWEAGRASLGQDIRENVGRLLKSFAYAFLRVAGMSVETYRTLIQSAESALEKDGPRLYYTVYVVTARRPHSRR